MKKIRLTFFLFAILVYGLQAQQLANWTQFRAFQYATNPAIVDIFDFDADQMIDLDLVYRKQWTSFEGAPETALLGLQYVNDRANMSLGGLVLNDEFGPTSYSQLQLQYAYQIKMDPYGESFLSIGLAFAANQFRVDADKLKVENPNDQLIGDSPQSKTLMNGSFGLYYQGQLGASRFNRKFIIAGLSAEQMIPADLQIEGNGSTANLKRALHYHAFLGTRFYYGSGYDFVEPVVWAKAVHGAPINYFFATKMTFSEQRFWLGAGVSSEWEGHLLAGVGLSEQIHLGYATSFYLANTFGSDIGLTHEIRLAFRGMF